MKTSKPSVWIFQGNPDFFDIDGYLAASGGRIIWLVNQHADKIRIGDTVYLWKAAGKKKAPSGIIAAARVDSEVFVGPDEAEAHPYWISGDPTKNANRVWMRILRVAKPKEIVKVGALREDPICRDLLILKQPAGTNFPVSENHAKRLEILWQGMGTDWSYSETVASLKVYAQTKGGPISTSTDSEVSELAINIGRTFASAYTKLMNFRALDPTDDRKGMSASATEDKRVWDAFFDPDSQAIRMGLLQAEYERLWDSVVSEADASAFIENLKKQTEALTQCSMEELDAKLAKNPPVKKPRRLVATSSTFERDARVRAKAIIRANHRCEVPGCTWTGFHKPDRMPFIEVHHIQPLAEGGEDTPENAVAVCPGHHRELHHGKQAEALKEVLAELRKKWL
jgi:predicted HNH restriction endonuclease